MKWQVQAFTKLCQALIFSWFQMIQMIYRSKLTKMLLLMTPSTSKDTLKVERVKIRLLCLSKYAVMNPFQLMESYLNHIKLHKVYSQSDSQISKHTLPKVMTYVQFQTISWLTLPLELNIHQSSCIWRLNRMEIKMWLLCHSFLVNLNRWLSL